MIFTEAPITEYERSRNEEIMKNDRELERLGIKTLVPIVNNTSVERKGEDHEVSGSLYIGQESGQESEDCEDEEVISKVASAAHTKNPTRSGNTSVRGTKASKRVVAPQEQDVPNRVTRQKTRDLALVSSPDPQQRQEKYKDVQPTAIDLFEDFHCSKNKGFSEPIKKAIADMEAIMAEPVQDEEQPKSVNYAVSQVVKSTTFLQIVGIQPNSNNSSKGCTSSKVQQLRADLEIEKKSKEDLRHEFEAMKKESKMTMETLKKESEMARAKQAEEIKKIKKASQETMSFRQMLGPRDG
ncbi:unnamed protein product [Miscanthus lutarioriparius]|uniref:Uncharacterized protein n=1 Tax=Miscanthus lutarioriparius TaxID=422564 RepID=A0A811RPZ8_9POAL|nr:unnamed protein product [Miscanthus lutarioriparius]